MINRNRYILSKLAKVNVKDRKAILTNAPSELFQVLNLILKMLADDKVKLSNTQKEKIKKHKGLIRRSSDLKITAIKRMLKNQRGGFIPAIIAAALPLIGPLIKKLL